MNDQKNDMVRMDEMDTADQMDVFRVRLNCIDHYQAVPTRYDPWLRRDSPHAEPSRQPKVPVIRVFGSTETGQKVCAHMHGAFPYLYIEYRGPLDKPTGAWPSHLFVFNDMPNLCSHAHQCPSTSTPSTCQLITPWRLATAGINTASPSDSLPASPSSRACRSMASMSAIASTSRSTCSIPSS